MARRWKKVPEILISPNIPRKLFRVNPRTILGQAWWNRTREEAYRSTNYHCKACGVHKLNGKFSNWLEGHELYDINYNEGVATYLHTVPLCTACHMYVHMGRLHWLMQTQKITHRRFKAVIVHGDSILSEVGLSRFDKITGNEEIAERWKLVMNGQIIAERG